jgi:hypothetical protein
VQTLPLAVLSTSDAYPEANMIRLKIPYPNGFSPAELHRHHVSVEELLAPRIFAPHYGIFAVTLRTFRVETEGLYIPLIHFWPAHITRDSLDFGQGCVYQHQHPIYAMAVGDSGTYAVILVKREDESYLGLLHFSATPMPHTTFRKLDIRDVSLSFCVRIALDDALGLVFVGDTAGVITVISYV